MRLYKGIFLFVLTCGFSLPVLADVTAASIFGDNMVLQRGLPVPVWGTAAPGEKITVSFNMESELTTAGADGKWLVKLPAMRANSTPGDLLISGQNTIRFSNVLVGEVWICSGQSNMEFLLAGARNARQEIIDANFPQIRMFTVEKNPSPLPLERCNGSWQVCTPKTVPIFSAVGYFYARDLYNALHVPIGMIHTSWGGTPAETWTSLPALKALPLFKAHVESLEKALHDYQANKDEYMKAIDKANGNYVERLQDWYTKQDADDPGMKENWMAPAQDSKTWKSINFPVDYATNPLPTWIGTMWCRKEVEIPQAWVGKELELHIGAVDEADDTYVNGQHVGRIWFDAPNYWTARRTYPVPAALVTSTKVVVTVRVLNKVGQLGLFGPADDMLLRPKDSAGETPVSLAGDWRYQFALEFKDLPQSNQPLIPGANAGDLATLYNGMIAPLIPYGIRGAIWYQGESNAGAPLEYRQLFPAMITCWRQAWHEGDFPFAFVQLANFMAMQQQPVEIGSWAELREAQLLTLKLPNTGMAVINDIGAADDIHPKDKQDVGKRLALAMLAQVYGKHLEYSGPFFEKMKVKGAQATLTFSHANGLQTMDSANAKVGPLLGFAIAGADRVFHTAQARIAGNKVIVWSDKVPQPVAVRYAWANNPVCNLYNAAGLPTSSFRTDDWDAATVKAAE